MYNKIFNTYIPNVNKRTIILLTSLLTFYKIFFLCVKYTIDLNLFIITKKFIYTFANLKKNYEICHLNLIYLLCRFYSQNVVLI